MSDVAPNIAGSSGEEGAASGVRGRAGSGITVRDLPNGCGAKASGHSKAAAGRDISPLFERMILESTRRESNRSEDAEDIKRKLGFDEAAASSRSANCLDLQSVLTFKT